MSEPEIGYDVVRYLVDPPKYRAHRIRHGRYVKYSDFFETLKEAHQWIEAQRGLDRDDRDRARIPPPKREQDR